MNEERRTSPRHPATLHAQVETESGRYTVAVTQDVSASGLLVLSHHEITGRVAIHVLVDGEQRVVQGTVVRQEPVTPPSERWRVRSAVALDPGEHDAARIVEALRAAQAVSAGPA